VTDYREDRITLASSDLDVLARLTAARFDDRGQEAHRLAQLDELNGAMSAVSRALAALGRHSISECRGSHSKWDVTEDTRAFYDALCTYASLVRAVAGEYRALSAEPAEAIGAGVRRRNLSVL
jgi:hypothetical protein